MSHEEMDAQVAGVVNAHAMQRADLDRQAARERGRRLARRRREIYREAAVGLYVAAGGASVGLAALYWHGHPGACLLAAALALGAVMAGFYFDDESRE